MSEHHLQMARANFAGGVLLALFAFSFLGPAFLVPRTNGRWPFFWDGEFTWPVTQRLWTWPVTNVDKKRSRIESPAICDVMLNTCSWFPGWTYFWGNQKGHHIYLQTKLCRKLRNISQEKCLEFRDHEVVYLEMIQSGTDGDPILCPVVGLISYCWPCPILYDNLVWQTLFSVVPRRIFLFSINKFQARVCDTQFRYDVFMPVFFAVAMRIDPGLQPLRMLFGLFPSCRKFREAKNGDDQSFPPWLKNRACSVTKEMPQQNVD